MKEVLGHCRTILLHQYCSLQQSSCQHLRSLGCQQFGFRRQSCSSPCYVLLVAVVYSKHIVADLAVLVNQKTGFFDEIFYGRIRKIYAGYRVIFVAFLRSVL
jgi:hypothetical protein